MNNIIIYLLNLLIFIIVFFINIINYFNNKNYLKLQKIFLLLKYKIY